MSTIVEKMADRKKAFAANMRADYAYREMTEWVSKKHHLTAEEQAVRDASPEVKPFYKDAVDQTTSFCNETVDRVTSFFKKEKSGSDTTKKDEAQAESPKSEEAQSEAASEEKVAEETASGSEKVESPAASENNDANVLLYVVETKKEYLEKSILIVQKAYEKIDPKTGKSTFMGKVTFVSDEEIHAEFLIEGGDSVTQRWFKADKVVREDTVTLSDFIKTPAEKQVDENDIEHVAKKVVEEQPEVASNAMADALLNAKRGNHRRNHRHNHHRSNQS